jgi:ABC-type transport system involved in multi-copper enzyme maturation permease subunit
MHMFREIFRFELRFQARSPVWIAAAALFFLIHFLAARRAGISIGVGPIASSETLNLNAALAIIQVEFALSILMLFPAAAVVATAITRDYELRTAELFFSRPIREPSYVLGRLCGGLPVALAAGIAGTAGTITGHLVPGTDPARLGDFAAAPYAFAFIAGVLPNTLIVAMALSSGAALTRSIAGAFVAAVLLVVLFTLAQSLTANPDTLYWAALADPFGVLATVESTRYWTLAEVTTYIPAGSIWVNRAIWVGIATVAFAATLARFRFALQASLPRTRPRSADRPMAASSPAPSPAPARRGAKQRIGWRGTIAQFRSQLAMDLRVVFRSPPFYLVLALTVWGAYLYVHGGGELLRGDGLSVLGYSVVPLTTFLVDHLEFGTAELTFLTLLYYGGELVHRERKYRVAEMVDASPVANGTIVASKTVALCMTLLAIPGVSVLAFIAMQALSGVARLDLAVYLQATLFVQGIGQYVLAAVAVTLLLLVRNRWLGTLLVLMFLLARAALGPLGFTDLLYQFRLPSVGHSDMNGFAAFGGQVWWLSAYWGAFIALLLIAGHLIAQRGYYDRLRGRLADARSRLTPATFAATAGATAAFLGLGAWVFYNEHVLNDFVGPRDAQRQAADYERRYRSFYGLAVPQPTSLDLELDVFPGERRAEVRGVATLVNDGDSAISDVLVQLRRDLRLNAFELGSASLVEADPDLANVFFYRFDPPLAPGATLEMRWDASWRNDGFGHTTNVEIVPNGTFIEGGDVMPMLGYVPELELDSESTRRRLDLGPREPLPDLDDPEHEQRYGRRLYADLHVVMSTSADQVAVASGERIREWTENGRRYVEFRTPQPVFPALMFASARYAVARDAWNGIDIEIYHDPRHTYGVPTLLATARAGLEYYSGAFGDYPLRELRIVEYPRYRTFARPYVGAIAYPEMLGFVTRYPPGAIDFGVAHELAHYWWGGRIRTPYLQGQRLNEALASYSAFMLIREVSGFQALEPELALALDRYLSSRQALDEELPLIRTEEAGIAYSKGALVLYALHDIIGDERMNLALSRLVERFGDRPPPFATSRDLVAELRAAAGDEHQDLITDLWERITFYDVMVTSVATRPIDQEFEVTIGVNARQLDAAGDGTEQEVPLDTWFDVAVFPSGGGSGGSDFPEPLYLVKHRLVSGEQQIVMRVAEPPARVGVDPHRKMIDRNSADNVREIP